MNSTVEIAAPHHFLSYKVESIHRKIGDFVKEGEVICTLSFEKDFLAVEADTSGILTRWYVEKDKTIQAGERICTIEKTLKITQQSFSGHLVLDEKIHVLSDKTSIADVYLQELRNLNTQQDRAKFRNNVERLGMILAYKVSEHLEYSTEYIDTPLSATQGKFLRQQPVLASILRAGLPLHQGFLNIFEQADNAYIAAYRKTTYNHDFEIRLEYVATPELDNRTLILLDPMLATGSTLIAAVNALKTYGMPKAIHMVSIIASRYGVQYIRENLPQAHIWTVAIDPELNIQSYIIPGLGDAGDLALGKRIG
ncbi:MAG: uracil phosphoribosyltransferase [Bacteroidia bacterium]|nr:uracil phosphoribosyltransferase [Bacteroidia bacterium]MDW8302623.1 uracil phosphoribosyltransferase [Bacteroidia bacterium]